MDNERPALEIARDEYYSDLASQQQSWAEEEYEIRQQEAEDE